MYWYSHGEGAVRSGIPEPWTLMWKNRVFQPDEDITVCTQFGIDGQTENARKFLDADEYELLEDFENNLEKIKDAITGHGGQKPVVDDMPYVLGLGMDVVLNLHDEYKKPYLICLKSSRLYQSAFFRELLERPRRTKAVIDCTDQSEHQSGSAAGNQQRHEISACLHTGIAPGTEKQIRSLTQ